MLPKSISKRVFLRKLKQELNAGHTSGTKLSGLNPAQSYLILFNGTRPEDVEYFRQWHTRLEKMGIKVKMLAFVESSVDVHDFGMALYTKTGIDWKQLPKPKLIELVQSRTFDLLFHINPAQLPHLHFLAVAANARFKVSTLSQLPNDFDLTLSVKSDMDQQQIYEEMLNTLHTLSV